MWSMKSCVPPVVPRMAQEDRPVADRPVTTDPCTPRQQRGPELQRTPYRPPTVAAVVVWDLECPTARTRGDSPEGAVHRHPDTDPDRQETEPGPTPRLRWLRDRPHQPVEPGTILVDPHPQRRL